MRLLISLSLLVFAVSCTGGKKFASTAPTAAATPEPPKVNPPASEAIPDTIDSESVLPGDPVEKFGINFEDNPFGDNSDKDYNDAVLCFDGKFVIQNSSIISSENQTVPASAFSNAGCGHDIEIIITHADGTVDESIIQALTRGEEKKLELAFKKGDSIEVKMGYTDAATDGVCADAGRHSMKENLWAQIAKDTCNDTGE